MANNDDQTKSGYFKKPTKHILTRIDEIWENIQSSIITSGFQHFFEKREELRYEVMKSEEDYRKSHECCK